MTEVLLLPTALRSIPSLDVGVGKAVEARQGDERNSVG
jgi:hypothetical protein